MDQEKKHYNLRRSELMRLTWVSKVNLKKLKEMGAMGDSYDTVITNLIEEKELAKEK